MNRPQHIELGRPARPGQLILQRRFNLARQLIANLDNTELMLDLGCGNGAQTVHFASSAKRLIGVDVVPITQAESSLSSGLFNFIQSDAGYLPFRSGIYNLVTAFEILEHVPDDRLALKEVARVLKSSGLFLLSVPNKWWVFESHGATVPGLNWIPWNRMPLIGWLPGFLHRKIARARIYTIKSAGKLVEEAGLRVRAKGYITAPLDVFPEGRMRNTLRSTIFKSDTTRIPFLAVNLFLLCQKDP